jgi:putative endonuclease
LRCADKTYYTGVTIDVKKRLKAHNSGFGAKYTSGRIPVELVYQKDNLTENQARKVEFALKKLSRKAKERIIQGKIV